MGITLPFWAVYSSRAPFGLLDILACVLCLSGIALAYFADTQLYEFVSENERLVFEKKKPKLLLDTGLWRYSRHPNHFAEQLFWWGFSLFAASVGQWWMLIGTFINSAALHVVMDMVEERMLRREERRSLYKEYQRTTSRCIPWFK